MRKGPGSHADHPRRHKKDFTEDYSGEDQPWGMVMTDGWTAYDGPIDVGKNKHFRIKKHCKESGPFTDRIIHVYGFKNFSSYIKRRLARLWHEGKLRI